MKVIENKYNCLFEYSEEDLNEMVKKAEERKEENEKKRQDEKKSILKSIGLILSVILLVSINVYVVWVIFHQYQLFKSVETVKAGEDQLVVYQYLLKEGENYYSAGNKLYFNIVSDRTREEWTYEEFCYDLDELNHMNVNVGVDNIIRPGMTVKFHSLPDPPEIEILN